MLLIVQNQPDFYSFDAENGILLEGIVDSIVASNVWLIHVHLLQIHAKQFNIRIVGFELKST